jgi:AraC-like DNA-binding protein
MDERPHKNHLIVKIQHYICCNRVFIRVEMLNQCHMLPVLEKIPSTIDSSITVKFEVSSVLDYPWHFHPEYEIIWIERSYGMRFMGDNIDNFSAGEVVFISPNLPHVWKNHDDFYQNKPELEVRCIVIHFREDAFGAGFFQLPEMKALQSLFERGKQGILFTSNKKKIIDLMKKILVTKGLGRTILFLEILKLLSEHKHYRLLAIPGFNDRNNLNDTARIGKIYDYTVRNYREEIDMGKISSIIAMSKSSFCRYFKSRTRKTYSRFVNEIRIGHACKLLIESDMTTSSICYNVGYNNISHFNRQFREITQMTSGEYRKKHKRI